MLLVYGEETVRNNWFVNETSPPAFARIYCVDDGEVTYTEEKRHTSLRKKHVYIFPTSSPYNMKHNPFRPLTCVYLHLDLFPNLVEKLLEIDLTKDEFANGLFQAIRMAVRSKENKTLTLLCEALITDCIGKKLITQPSVVARNVMEYISLHLKEDISIESLSKIAGYNPQYLIRIFKKSTGITPHQYIINQRLKEAVKLLQINLAITEIAQRVGYPDVKSFGRAFKLKYGISPSNFYKVVP